MGEGSISQTEPRALRAYLLGTMPFEEANTLQRRLMYEVAGDRGTGAVMVLEHPPGITIGREGSRQHVRLGSEALAAREWPIRWLARGGGAMLHLPGQVACYPILPLDQLGLNVCEYLVKLHAATLDVLADFGVRGETIPNGSGMSVNGRRIAHVGVAVRDWVTGYGVVLNVNPDLQPFHDVHCDGEPTPMTSLQRESAVRVRIAGVRQRFIDAIASRFGFARVSLFHHQPAVVAAPGFHAVPHGSR